MLEYIRKQGFTLRDGGRDGLRLLLSAAAGIPLPVLLLSEPENMDAPSR